LVQCGELEPVQLLEIQQYLHQHIPLSAAMDVRVVEWTREHLILQAPLAPNHNHLGTAFGGSLNAVATLTGYAAVWLALDDSSAHVVIRESTIAFRRPVRGDIRAECPLPSKEVQDAFRNDFNRKGKARLSLQVFIVHEGERAVEFTATFVAVK
jgi:thioesterase domain-containing protein